MSLKEILREIEDIGLLLRAARFNATILKRATLRLDKIENELTNILIDQELSAVEK